ncbi:MAG: molybdopterin-guanine dinucleotide biosynthesis protein B [Methanomassiliicoccales archaeon]|nr:MAG: molybdopterin-guanine dinucleotide biosynthesis protein B [Methanomassiliicoccales archaeon]
MTMILGIYGESKSGKTTLIMKLISQLKEKGYRVGSVKNIHIPDFTIDSKEKDTWKHTKAQSEVVVARSKNEVAFLVNRNMAPEDVVSIVDNIAKLDIIIVEGYWDDDSPKIAVGDIEEKPNTVLRYKDNFDEIHGYAIEGIEVEKVKKTLPGLDCGKCGLETCRELALSIRLDKNSFRDCYYFSEKKVSLEIDGKKIPMGKFAKEIVAGTIDGMVSSLKGVEGGKDIKLEIIYGND